MHAARERRCKLRLMPTGIANRPQRTPAALRWGYEDAAGRTTGADATCGGQVAADGPIAILPTLPKSFHKGYYFAKYEDFSLSY
jgi:hypothetical protein